MKISSGKYSQSFFYILGLLPFGAGKSAWDSVRNSPATPLLGKMV